MAFDLRAELAKRSWWMNAIFAFCVFMTFVYMPYDVFVKGVEGNDEIWFGFVLTGWTAKLTEPLHWAIYAAGAWGFWKMSSWMWPWAAVYSAQVTLAMLLFPLLNRPDMWWTGVISGAVFALPTVALWRARRSFQPSRA
jgi:hypothetical protein